MLTVYVDECEYKRCDKHYTRSLICQSYRQDGKIKHQFTINYIGVNECPLRKY